ncbi:ThuA domain-containing protein [Cohnella boryungensis]|uniref:ThuA domain-containing protein n=1 Tax=Cohnella boryungensis TaxID=768479 RepID=A0ABV8S4N4_9BACL
MSDKAKALVLGDYTNFKYHQLPNMDLPVTDLLRDHLETVCTEDYDQLRAENIGQYALVISYTDCWRRELSEEQIQGLLGYVRNGGGLLVIHNGISLQTSEELMRMMGARLNGHPPYGILEIRAAADDHDLVRGIEPFTVTDEPYQFDFVEGLETTILLDYEYDGKKWPAGWTHAYGEGQVVYLMNGHDGSPFFHPTYREIILRSAVMLSRTV